MGSCRLISYVCGVVGLRLRNCRLRWAPSATVSGSDWSSCQETCPRQLLYNDSPVSLLNGNLQMLHTDTFVIDVGLPVA